MSLNAQTKEFLHPTLNNQIIAIGGRYLFLKEERLPVGDREVVFLTGVAVFDSTCCGAGGCSYALVPGFIVKWRYKTGDNGNMVSLVEPVLDDPLRQKIRKKILKKELVYQVDFL